MTTDNKQEKIIEKIKKVLELSKNNPSEEEAKAAALKAQELMAQYHISMQMIDDVEDIENIVEESVNVGSGNKWKYRLAIIVARNFRCKTFYYGSETVVFYGYETDAKIAGETFKYLFKVGNKSATSYYNRLRNDESRYGYFDGRGVKNCFLVGYLKGISDSLDKQCTALMIIVPQEVKDSYDERTKGFKRSSYRLNTRSYYGQQARDNGYSVGRNAMSSKQIAMA